MIHWLNERILSFAEKPFCLSKEISTHIQIWQRPPKKPKNLHSKWNPTGPYRHPKRGLHPKRYCRTTRPFEIKAMVAPIATDADNERIQRIQASNAQWEIFAEDNTPYKIQALKSEKDTHPFVTSLIEKEEGGLILFSSGSTGKPKAMIHLPIGFYSASRINDRKT